MKDQQYENSDKKVVIIDGGPGDSTASSQLSEVCVGSVILEKDQTLGGLLFCSPSKKEKN